MQVLHLGCLQGVLLGRCEVGRVSSAHIKEITEISRVAVSYDWRVGDCLLSPPRHMEGLVGFLSDCAEGELVGDYQ